MCRGATLSCVAFRAVCELSHVYVFAVAPYVGVWVEILVKVSKLGCPSVAPCMGALVEMHICPDSRGIRLGYSLCGSAG